MVQRMRDMWATVSSKPWRRAPLLLRRRPGVLATVAGACAVMSAAIAAVPLFLSSVGTASVALQAAERCPRDTGVSLGVAATPGYVRSRSSDPFATLDEQLEPASRSVQMRLSLAGADPERATTASLLTRDGAPDHVELLEGAPGPGIWIPDRAAETTGLGVGDTATIALPSSPDGAERPAMDVPVVGTYRDVSSTTIDDFWCSSSELVLVVARGGDLIRPDPMILVDDDIFAEVMEGLGVERARGTWEARLGDGLTVTDAEELIEQLGCETDASAALQWCASGQRPPVGTTSGRERTPVQAEDADHFVERFFRSHLPFVTERSSAIQASVGGGIWPVAGLAGLAGAGLVAASASLWFDRRRRELSLLSVRGVSPLALGTKGVLELVIPSVVGVAAGIGLAYLLVVWLGPSPVLEPASIGRAALGGVLAWLIAAATILTVTAWRARAHEDRRRRRARLGAMPWELLLAGLTFVSYRRLDAAGIPVHDGAEVSRSDPLGLLFPVLFIVTVVAVVSRLLALALRPLRRLSRTWPTALYLGVRRVARYRVAVLGLVAASAIAAGVLGYATTLNRSLDATLAAKGKTFVGSDVAVRLVGDQKLPEELQSRSTQVRLHKQARIEGDRREPVTVVAINPDTFQRGAFWDATFADSSLEDLLDQLEAPPAGGRIPAVVVGGDAHGTVEVAIVDGPTERFEVDVIEGVHAFPGMRRPEPTVFVDHAALEPFDLLSGSTEAWIRGDPDETIASLQAAETAFYQDRELADAADRASFMTVTWTFGFMQSLALSAGLLVLGGVAVYLDARRRERLLGNAFMRRMGLTRSQHRSAVGIELMASVLAGCLLGLATAMVAAWLAHGLIDPVPGFRPEPLLRRATGAALVLALAAGAVCVAGAVLAQRRIDRDDPVEVLRAGA